MKFSLIACMDKNGAIGKSGTIPWHVPSDLKRFKAITSGHIVIMGRRTFESLGRKPLPNRFNIVVSSQIDIVTQCDPNLYLVKSLKEAVGLALYHGKDKSEAFIIGGTALYAEALSVGLVDTMHLTHLNIEVEGADTFFPHFEAEQLKEMGWRRDYHTDGTDEKSGIEFVYAMMVKKHK